MLPITDFSPEFVAGLLLSSGKSQKEFAKEIGVHPSNVWLWKRGKAQTLKKHNWESLCRAYDKYRGGAVEDPLPRPATDAQGAPIPYKKPFRKRTLGGYRHMKSLIPKIRKKYGVSQKDFASLMLIPVSRVRGWEEGKIKVREPYRTILKGLQN